MRLVEATFPASCSESVLRAVSRAKPVHWRMSDPNAEGTRVLHALYAGAGAQTLIDALHTLLEGRDDWRILILPVEATAPALPEPEDDGEKARRKRVAIREEVSSSVAKGAELGPDFLILTALSTIVAAIGLGANNVAVVIGAMVIAPLLGPVLAFSFATSLGDFALMVRAARTALAGLLLGFVLAFVMGIILPLDMGSTELTSRTRAGLDAVALALASGAAAALSIVTGISSALVGVMVAVALLPPAAAAGLFAGAGEYALASRALLLLTVNVVCVILAAQAVYAYKGVRPRTWLEQKSAKKAVRTNVVSLVALLAVLILIVLFAPAPVFEGALGALDAAGRGN